MIPYIELPSIPLFGSLAIQPFGVLLATGIYLGVQKIKSRAKERGLNVDAVQAAVSWCLIPGFIGAFFLEVLLYEPMRLFQEGLAAFSQPNLSSYGGLFSATLGFFAYLKKYKPKNIALLSDVLLEGAVIGFTFGRLGCAVVHDHPGIATNFFLGVKFPDMTRHDLGLYEFLFIAAILLPTSQWIARTYSAKKIQAGYQRVLLCLVYAPVRFLLEFLRADASIAGDTRYLGLTPAQYFSVLFFGYGIYLLKINRNQKAI